MYIVYQRFGHRCSYYQWPRYFAHHSSNFYRGQKVRFLVLSLNNARFWAAAVWKPSKISSPFLNLVCTDHLTMLSPNLVQIGLRVFKAPMLWLEHPLKWTKNMLLIINISAVDWSISLKFGTYRNYVIFDQPQKFKVKGSKVKVTAWRYGGQNFSNCE